MTNLVVHPLEKALVGSVPVPSDRSIGHGALLLASLCDGVSNLRGFAYGEDNRALASAMRAMGAAIVDTAPGEVTVTGTGLFGLRPPGGALECGSSGVTVSVLAGLLAGQPFASSLVSDGSLSRHPMMRIVQPLRARGAIVDGAPHPTEAGELVAPLRVGPLPRDQQLGALEHASPVASAEVKSALLLSGLYAHGSTHFKEPTLSRDHTERMLHALGVPLRTAATMIELDPAGWSGKLPAFDMTIPGDASAAAFLLVAAQIHEGSRVTVRGVGVNPTRMGLLEIARYMGAGVDVVPQGEQGGEPIAEVTAWCQGMRGITISGEIVPRAVDEVPLACALAARARGTTTIRDVARHRVDESDRVAAMAGALRAFGITCEELPDGLAIEGKEGPLEAARIESRGDHRVAMTAAVLALGGRAPSTIVDCDCIGASFPRFVGTLRALGARIEAV
jgi:3-phosphoshikimate 1-carboxyvinyltransferase